MLRLLSAVNRQLASERERLPLFAPLPVMAGVAAYFALPFQPAWWILPAMLLSCLPMLWGAWGRPIRWIIIPICLCVAGFAASDFRTHRCATPLLMQEIHNRTVQGVIDEIDRQEKSVRLILANPVIEGVSAAETPVRVRLSFRAYDPAWRIGDRLRVKATLYPPPQPTQPGGYDFARHLYFLQIGAGGFALHPPEITGHVQGLGFRQGLNALRHRIGDDMRARMPGPAGTVAAAMTVGETGPIPDAVKAQLRDAGLSHMLAIAGLHLGLVAGIVFFAVRLLLAAWPRAGLRLPVKKLAAGCALASAAVYLCLAGFPIPAERSFIMAAFVFTAMMLDRRGISLRTLMLAAMFILLVMPESMFGASFQMSFSATLAIVAVYEHFGRYLHAPNAAWWRQARAHGLGIAATSISATFATAPFVLYNFDRFASFGVVANMLVIPLAAFVIMPGVVLSLLLMPLGLQGIGYFVLSYGVELMLWASAWVTSLPYAALLRPAPGAGGVVLAALGLMWLCMMRQRWRLLGIPFIAAGVATMALHSPPDIFISGDARQVMARLPGGGYTMLKGAARSFTVQTWLRSEGQEKAEPRADTDVECDKILCRWHGVVVLKHPPEGLEEACTEQSDVLIGWWYLHREHCPAPRLLVGRGEMEAHGAREVWLQPLRSVSVWEEGHGNRPWEVVPAEDDVAAEDD